MSTCADNHATGRIGCGATFNGRQQHAVARVPWSEHADGRAHVTFSTEGAADLCWKGERFIYPGAVRTKAGERLLERDAKGVWRYAGKRPDYPGVAEISASNGPDDQ